METSQPALARVIEPPKGWSLPDLGELWEYRDLVFFLARRDVAVRYRQSAVGVFWAILQPVLLAAVFSLFLGQLAGIASEPGIPYPLFVLSGMVMWLFFASATEKSATSTVNNADLISRVYFPRLVIPVAAVIAPTIDFLIALVVVIVVALAYGFTPEVQILLLPAVVILALATALGIGLWMSAVNVKYRDVHLVVPFMLLVGLFITPIIYPFDSTVPDAYQPLYALNPMVGVLEAYRWMLLGVEPVAYTILVPVVSSVVLLVSGAVYFQRAEQTFADVI